MHRSTTARALIICTMVLGLSSLAAPALAGHESDDTEDGYSEEYDSDERAGHGSHLGIEVECDSVEATSNHKISTVTVYFADGTEEEIEVDEREYSDTFTETIDHAIAESHKEWVVDEAEDCEAEPEPSESPDDDDADTGDSDGDDTSDPDSDADSSDAGSSGADSDGSGDNDAATRTSGGSGDGTDGSADSTRATTSTRTTSTAGVSGAETASTGGGTAAMPAPTTPAFGSGLIVGGNAEVFGMVFHQGIKTCPSGPFKGMPYINIKDCGDSVLGTRLALTGSGTGIFTVLGLSLVALGSLLLRVRRSRGVA